MNRCSLLLLPLAISLACHVGCGRNVSTAKQAVDDSEREFQTMPVGDGPDHLDELRVLGKVPSFSLIDQDGNSFAREQLDGKIWVATFIFTRCGLTCPAQTSAFAELQRELLQADSGDRVHLVSFTVDPEFDTPAVLAKYGKKASADFQTWHFLTGDRGALWDLCKDGFKLPVNSGRDETSLINHSQMFVLVDSQSKIRGVYAGLSADANAQLRRDIKKLLDQPVSHRTDDVVEISMPDDVRDPLWMADRAKAQVATAGQLDVFCDFKFADHVEQSGIDFKDEVVEDVKRLFKPAHYDHGTGVAVADIDNDGMLDIYFVSQFGENQLWRNLGDGKFINVTETAGVAVPDEVSVAASFADIDNDGDADLYVTRVRAPNKLFLNDGSGRFEDISETAGVDHIGHSSGSTFFDYDRDGLLDLLLTNVGEYTTDSRGPGGYYLAHEAAFSGHLHEDRAEESILFRNLGDHRFENVNEQVGFKDASWTGDATPIDANDDGWPDIYLLNMQGHDEYWENQQGKRFVNKSRELFPLTAWGTMGVKVFDYNRDGRLDLYVTDMHTDMWRDLEPDQEKQKAWRNPPVHILATDGNHILGNAFYRKDGPDQFTEISDEIGVENYWPWGISVADLNADGFEDVFIAASMSYPYRYGINSVLLNEKGKRFVDSEFILGVEPRRKGTAQRWMQLDLSGQDAGLPLYEGITGEVLVWGAIGTRSSVIFDIEGDGDLDIVTNDFGGAPMVMISNLQERRDIRFLKVLLEGRSSNRDGLGALVELHVAGRKLLSVHDGKSGYLSQSRAPLYFGLGDSQEVDRIEITWPSGTKQIVAGPIQANQLLTIVEE